MNSISKRIAALNSLSWTACTAIAADIGSVEPANRRHRLENELGRRISVLNAQKAAAKRAADRAEAIAYQRHAEALPE